MKSIEERFWSKVAIIPEQTCWEWVGTIHHSGYGTIYVDDKSLRAHRLSWKIHNGPIPEGLLVCHTCDNRKCVRPEHLFLGTNADNNKDMFKKGRENKAKGTACRSTKLTEQQVKLIRYDPRPQSVIGKQYGISQNAVKLIKQRKNWKHIP